MQNYYFNVTNNGATKAWATELLCDMSLFASMVLVALPDGLAGGAASSSLTYENAEQIQDTLYHQFKIEVYDAKSDCIRLSMYYCRSL